LAGGSGDAGGEADLVRADGGGGGFAVERGRECAGGSGEVERDRSEREPGRVRAEVAGGQVRERPVLQVCDDLFDDRVAAVVTLGGEHRQRRVGEHGVVAPGGEQFALGVHVNVVGVGVAHPPYDQPCLDLPSLRAGAERGELDLGDLGVADPLAQLLVEDRPGYRIAVHASSPIPAIAAFTARSLRAVMEKCTPWRRAAAITSAP
jgi:hypothetical protein